MKTLSHFGWTRPVAGRFRQFHISTTIPFIWSFYLEDQQNSGHEKDVENERGVSRFESVSYAAARRSEAILNGSSSLSASSLGT